MANCLIAGRHLPHLIEREYGSQDGVQGEVLVAKGDRVGGLLSPVARDPFPIVRRQRTTLELFRQKKDHLSHLHSLINAWYLQENNTIISL